MGGRDALASCGAAAGDPRPWRHVAPCPYSPEHFLCFRKLTHRPKPSFLCTCRSASDRQRTTPLWPGQGAQGPWAHPDTMLHTHALNKPLSGPNGYKRLARLVVRAFYSGECPPRTPEEVERDQQLAASGRSRAVKVCARVEGRPWHARLPGAALHAGQGNSEARSAAAPAFRVASRVRLFTQRPYTAHAQPRPPGCPPARTDMRSALTA